MALSPLPTLDRTSSNFRESVDTFFGSQLPVFSVEVNALQEDVTVKHDAVSVAAFAANNSAAASLASAGQSLDAKNLAESAAITATNAAAAALQALDSFDDRYLGEKSVAPTVDNDGAAILAGAMYWDTVLNGGCLRVRQSGAWVTIPSNVASGITNTPAGNIAATTVQAAINELDSEKVAVTATIAVNRGGTGATTASAGADALGAFRKGTILGTVSQTAGVPTGAIIESGSNANGTYTKWADGTMICTHTKISTTGVSTAFGSVFSTGDDVWTYPVPYLTGVNPAVTAQVVAGVSYAWTALGAGTTPTTFSYRAFSPASNASAPHVSLIAIGRWF